MTTPLDELRFVGEADVVKAGVRAATLRREPTGVTFAYVDGYDGPPVATTLPLDEGSGGAMLVRTGAPGAVPPFFAGLLPEGRRLTALRQAVKTSADDDLTLLLAVGADTVGDVQVVPAGEEPSPAPARLTVDDWAGVSFADLYAEATGRSHPDRVGLPGVQEKVSAVMMTVPVAAAGARYLLKLDPPELPFLVANEAFFLSAAEASGLPVAEATVVHDGEGRAGLLVRRFDRVADDGWPGGVRPLAQEDGCQVLGRYPADKYQLDTHEVVGGLAAVCRAGPVAARDLFRQVAFAYLTANGDAHAKNFSVLRSPQGEWRVTPAYDIPSSHPYGDHTMALRLNGKTREDIGRADLLALAASVGLRERAAARSLDELCDRCDAWLGGVDDLPFDEHRNHKLRKAIEYRRARLRA